MRIARAVGRIVTHGGSERRVCVLGTRTSRDSEATCLYVAQAMLLAMINPPSPGRRLWLLGARAARKFLTVERASRSCVYHRGCCAVSQQRANLCCPAWEERCLT
jgi:hypothetical protein